MKFSPRQFKASSTSDVPMFRLILLSLLCSVSVCEAGLKIYYIRHAEGGHNVKRDWEDVPEIDWPDYVGDPDRFTPLGKKQLAAVSGTLHELEYRFDFIASSPLWRSRNTILPYMKHTGSTGEIWPELKELSVSGDYLFDPDLPKVTDPILGEGKLITLPADETDWFALRPGAENHFNIPDYGDDEEREAAAAIVVYQAAIDLIMERFGGTDQAILLAGHGASGKNLLRLLTKEVDHDSIENTGIWMVEQQADGSFKQMISNSVMVESAIAGSRTVRFDDLRADLSSGKVDGRSERHPDVTITKAKDELDVVYSFSLVNQDFDGAGGLNDSLSWDIRVKGFTGGRITDTKKESSVTLGAPAQAHMRDEYFGVSDKRYVESGDSIRFSVENVVLDAEDGTAVQFNGFDGIYGADDTYVFGEGDSGLKTVVTTGDDDFTFAPSKTLTLSCPTDKFRIRDLTGSFTVTSDRASFNSSWIRKPRAKAGSVFSSTLAGTASGSNLTYSKVTGPSWLVVAGDGTLSGTPGNDDAGANVFKVSVDNRTGTSDTMTLVVDVNDGE
ncbi:MAG: histidine phosphatase family protein [Verrucomicrobiales bacterium]|nr:histidine phosphatase family protein [Verrucomicrobiales bacterium]